LRQETPDASWWSRPAPAALYALAVLVAAAAALVSLSRAHGERLASHTGAAEWIWYSSRLPRPVALRFYATRDVVLRERPSRAMAKLFVDREHVLWVNGRRAGAGTQHVGDPLAVYRIEPLLVPGPNRIAIEASHPTGAGGILFSLDVAGYGRDALVSDSEWRVDPDESAITNGGRYLPMVWGRPPQYPWGFPRMPRPNELPEDWGRRAAAVP
jgi:hypothetical protein